jgi:hypothetical protein
VNDSDYDSAQLLEPDIQVHCTNILMRTQEDKTRIARTALELAASSRLSESVAETQ